MKDNRMISIKNKSVRLSNISTVLLGTIISFLTSLNASNTPFKIGNSYLDSSVFIYIARVILRGGMPYRDSFDHKGPLMYLIDALGLTISQKYGIWFVEFLSICFILYVSYKIAMLLGCGKISAIITIVATSLGLAYYFDSGNLTEEYACVFIILSLYLFLKFFIKGNVKNYELIICGLSFAAVCMLRINMVALWCVMCIGVLVDRISSGNANDLIRYILLFVAGAAIVIIPIFLWLYLNEAFCPFIKDYIEFNLLYSHSTLRQKFYTTFDFLTGAISIISIPVLVYASFSENRRADRLCLISYCASLLAMAISGRSYPHYGMVLIPLYTYAVSKFLQIFSKLSKTVCKTSQKALVLATFVLVGILFSQTLFKWAHAVINTDTPYASGDNLQIAEEIKKHTGSSDKITVCGNRNIIYLLSDRESSSIYSYTSVAADSSAVKEEYLAHVNSLEAKILVIEQDDFLYDEVKKSIADYYDLIKTVNTTEIYLLNSGQ